MYTYCIIICLHHICIWLFVGRFTYIWLIWLGFGNRYKLVCECMSCILSKMWCSFTHMQIISNTTISRPDSISQNSQSQEVGGLSGKPLFDLSTSALKEMYILTKVWLLSWIPFELWEFPIVFKPSK